MIKYFSSSPLESLTEARGATRHLGMQDSPQYRIIQPSGQQCITAEEPCSSGKRSIRFITASSFSFVRKCLSNNTNVFRIIPVNTERVKVVHLENWLDSWEGVCLNMDKTVCLDKTQWPWKIYFHTLWLITI